MQQRQILVPLAIVLLLHLAIAPNRIQAATALQRSIENTTTVTTPNAQSITIANETTTTGANTSSGSASAAARDVNGWAMLMGAVFYVVIVAALVGYWCTGGGRSSHRWISFLRFVGLDGVADAHLAATSSTSGGGGAGGLGRRKAANSNAAASQSGGDTAPSAKRRAAGSKSGASKQMPQHTLGQTLWKLLRLPGKAKQSAPGGDQHDGPEGDAERERLV